MRLIIPRLALSAVTILTVSCDNQEKSATEKSAKDFLAANLDTTVSPAEDFFRYANGGWIKKNPIPAEESAWGVGNLVQEDIYNRLRKINEDAAAKKAAEGTTEQKIGDFWLSSMDSASVDNQGLQPLQADLDKINNIKSKDDLISVAAEFHTKGINVLFTDYVAQDDKNSEVMAYQLYQGGLGMPNRDYYFNTDERTLGVKKTYQSYLLKTFIQLGNDSATAVKNAKAVYDLETRLAKSSRKLAALRDPEKNYNKMDMGKLNKLSSNLEWPSYLPKVGVNKLDSVIVGQPEFYAALNKELAKTSLDDWKNYLRFHLVRASASYLDKTTYGNYFDYRKTLSGATQQRPRWKRVLDAEENAMGEALGQLFVKEYFNETAKKRYTDLVEAIRDAYKERIQKLTWMSDSTKQKALDKLSKITPKVGYPDKWKDFSALKIDSGPYVLNVQRANAWWHNYNFNKLGKPVDRTEWGMSPQTYNAYYNPSNNEIVLPAGIFAVPGMRDEDIDDAFVYGYAAASTIGHEITHGFDDQGRQYDAKGNLTNWWTKKDSVEFVQKTKNIIKEFNEFNPVDTLHINGDATQGENIADLGGLLLGLDAFKKTEAYKKNEKIGGLSPLQRYFLGYAYGWMYEERKERLANQVMTDVHAPAKERVNGPMVNIPEFYEAFNIKAGDKMYRADSLRVRIW
jgi:putative endopeptidase